jgi:vitamin B12 transporter
MFLSCKKGALLTALLFCCLLLFSEGTLFSQEETLPGEYEDFLIMDNAEGLTVVGGTPETTQQMEVITREDIEKRNAPDVATLLQEMLNLGVPRYGGYGNMSDINLRGFDTERIAFLIDGVPANSVRSGEFDLYQIDLSSVERIEVIYGGSDTKYNVSGAFGGVINIITVKNQRRGLHLKGAVSNVSELPGKYREWDGSSGNPHFEDLLDAQNFNFGASYGGEQNSIEGSFFVNRVGNHFLYQDPVFKKTRRKVNNEVWDIGAETSYIRDLPDLAKLIAKGSAYYGPKNVPSSGYATDYAVQTDFSARGSIMLDTPRAFHDDLAAEASLSHNFSTMDYEPPSGADSHHVSNGVSAINRWAWYPTDAVVVRAGGDYRYNTVDSTDMNFHDRHDGGVYLTGEFSPVKRFTIIPSVKGIFASSGGLRAVPVPKLGFLWKISDAVTLKNNYFRNFKLPDFEDLYWPAGGDVAGDPNLKPEDGWGADLTFALNITGLQFDTTAFGQWSADSIHWAQGGDSVWRPTNVGAAVFFGSDSKLSYSLPFSFGPFKPIVVSLSYQYLLGRLLAYGYTWDDEMAIPYMPEHTIGGSIELPWKTGSVLVSGRFEGLRYAKRGNLDKLDPHFLLNINANQEINKNLNAFAVIRNVLNTPYKAFADYPMPGITMTLGIRFNIEGKKHE